MMQYRTYGKLGYKVSALGFGCMRLPRLYDGSERATVDREKAFELIRYAADHGVNYFDTAFTYHNGDSESVLGEALAAAGRRERVKVATKQPLRVMGAQADIRRNLETALRRLRTDYLDIYLVHFISAANWEEIKARRIIDEFERFRAEGLVRAVGFSYHGTLPAFRDILAYHPWDMCQVQQNLLDVDKEVTEEAIRLAGAKGCALVVMEPLRGGGLATPPPPARAIYERAAPGRSAVEWAFRHVLDYPAVSTVLSGMTTMEQLRENIDIFSQQDAGPGSLAPGEKEALRRVKETYESLIAVDCTGCGYCLPCSQNVNIPEIFDMYNEGMMFGAFDQPKRRYMFLTGAGRDASRCTDCGGCAEKCPQSIPVSRTLAAAHEALRGWIE